MTDEHDIDAALVDIRRKTNSIQEALRTIVGTGTAGNGAITAIVDASGRLRDLKLGRSAFQLGSQLPEAILRAAAAAEKDAAIQTERAIQPLVSDERITVGMKAIQETFEAVDRRAAPQRAMTDEEVQAADDAYFERMNSRGWR
ncbi:YbaB/EbfC family nucleoid-associated protein [Nocardia sp. NPDC003979]